MSNYIKREKLSGIISCMIQMAKRSKKRVGFDSLILWKGNEYWTRYAQKVEESMFHYVNNSGVYIYPKRFDNKYTIGQLEVIKFILDRRHKNGY